MSKKVEPKRPDEPLGIIISNGTRSEPIPIFSTYVWGPAPEASDEESRAA